MLAVYRAIQDTKAAVRYFYRDVQDSNNTYRIDTNRIAIVGQGSGGWIGLGYAAVKDTADLQLSKFLDASGNMLIDLNEIGDWNGYGGNPSINFENNVGYSSDIKMVCSIGGGMGALDWLDAGDVPIAAVHCRTDPVAIYTTGDVSVTTAAGLVDITTDISGSYDVVAKSNMLGNNDNISGINDAYTTAAHNASLAIVDSVDMFGQVIGSPVENLFPFNTGNPGESSPWDFWDSATTVNGAALFNVDGQQILANAALTNPDMSIAKSHAYMDSILGFFCPRIVNALTLPGNTVNIDKQNTNTGVKVYPNPSKGNITIRSNSGIIEKISIYNSMGKLVNMYTPNVANFTINETRLQKGIYFVKVICMGNKTIQKIIIE